MFTQRPVETSRVRGFYVAEMGPSAGAAVHAGRLPLLLLDGSGGSRTGLRPGHASS